jgi:diaminopropionate ammonia-lyase
VLGLGRTDAMPSRLLLNHEVAPLRSDTRPGPAVQAFHQRLPGYAPTPLRDMPALAAAAGVARVLVKDESSRFGLPAFKVLGASWAVNRVLGGMLADRLGAEPAWTTLHDLAAAVAREIGPLRLVAATDGNHGRAVAHMARLLGLTATILVPTGTADARVDGIAAEGAEVVVVPGGYDDAVTVSAGMASDRDLVISDTSWPGYENAPRWVIEGYSTIFAEIDAQLAVLGDPGEDVKLTGHGVAASDPLVLDLAVVPLGVGALGAAAGASLRVGREPGDRPVLLGVEPTCAACVAAAVEAGHVVQVPGPHNSIMAGLNCGLASTLALPMVMATFDALVAVDDDRAEQAVRTLSAAGLDVGETGAAALAGLMAVVEEHRHALPVPARATVLLLATEGVTDPAGFERIVGRPPRRRRDK